MNLTLHRNKLSPFEKILLAAIPHSASGGIALAVIVVNAGSITDAGIFAWGCVGGAALLGYLAYINQRCGIVSLCAALIAVFILVVPREYAPILLTQVLFAISITILVMQLNLKSGSPDTTKGGSDGAISY
jgi:hypothetical protein